MPHKIPELLNVPTDIYDFATPKWDFSQISKISLLTSATIPKGVTEIRSSTFVGCTGLTSVTILKDVAEIGDAAFQGCESLTIYAPAGSAVEKYAEKKGIKFETTYIGHQL